MFSKEQILQEIRRTAEENGGKPLGINKFEIETGIKPHEWGKYWAKFSNAQKDAGFTPNQLQSAYPDDFLFEKVIALIRKIGNFPTSREMRLEKIHSPEFPDNSVFLRAFGSKQRLVEKIIEYCKTKGDLDDVIVLAESILGETKDKENSIDIKVPQNVGEVYLFKSGKYYKIGKTNDTVRRGNELRIQLPEKMDLIHSIKTDDPSGVEAYWHRRFASKRKQGEWFDLNTPDIKAFKRWKRIF